MTSLAGAAVQRKTQAPVCTTQPATDPSRTMRAVQVRRCLGRAAAAGLVAPAGQHAPPPFLRCSGGARATCVWATCRARC